MKRNFLIIVLALQAAWLLGTAVVQERTLHQGELILLETRPVDPRDLLRGDYVVLNYKIGAVPLNKFRPPRQSGPKAGEAVFVVLAKHGDFHEVEWASTEPVEAPAGMVVLKGAASSSAWGGIEFGLERYYVHEGSGNPRGKLTVQVAVSKSGKGVIKQVFLDGEPYAKAMHRQSP
jgi:uncharacterized membrane-anchored protein